MYQLELNLTSKEEFPAEDVILIKHPAEILKTFWKKTLEGKYKQAEKHLSTVAKEQLNKQGERWEDVMTKFTTRYKINNVEVSDDIIHTMKKNEDKLYVPCKIFVYDSKKEKAKESIKETKMVFENGSWKIVDLF